MGATSTHPAGRIRQLVGSQLAGLALALFMVQHGAARSRTRNTR